MVVENSLEHGFSSSSLAILKNAAATSVIFYFFYTFSMEHEPISLVGSSFMGVLNTEPLSVVLWLSTSALRKIIDFMLEAIL